MSKASPPVSLDVPQYGDDARQAIELTLADSQEIDLACNNCSFDRFQFPVGLQLHV